MFNAQILRNTPKHTSVNTEEAKLVQAKEDDWTARQIVKGAARAAALAVQGGIVSAGPKGLARFQKDARSVLKRRFPNGLPFGADPEEYLVFDWGSVVKLSQKLEVRYKERMRFPLSNMKPRFRSIPHNMRAKGGASCAS